MSLIEDMSDRRRRDVRQHWLLLGKFVFAGALIYVLITSGRLDFRSLTDIGERWPWLAAAQIPFAGAMLLAAARWRILLGAQGIHYSFRDIFGLTLTGLFFNQMAIGTTGGDLYKAYAVAAERPDRRSGGVVSVVVDRALGLVVSLVIVGIALIWIVGVLWSNAELAPFAAVVFALLAAATLGLVVFCSKVVRNSRTVRGLLMRLPLQQVLRQIDQAISVYRQHKRRVAAAAMLSVLIQSFIVLLNLCIAHAILGDALPWMAFFALVPLAHLAMAIPINPPGAIGTGEAIYAYLFELVALSGGGLVCLVQRIIYFAWSLPGAILYVLRCGGGGAVANDWKDDASIA